MSFTTVMLCGVGGQGTILAADLLAKVAAASGLEVKLSEVHGMSQRGGSVTSHLRWGPQVFAPVIARGQADYLVAFEKLEAVRFIDMLRPGGTVLINDYSIMPATVNAGSAVYPRDDALQAALDSAGVKAVWIKGMEIAEGLGNSKTANVVLLGALSKLLGLAPEAWDEVLAGRVPAKYLELNRMAFQAGREAVSS